MRNLQLDDDREQSNAMVSLQADAHMNLRRSLMR